MECDFPISPSAFACTSSSYYVSSNDKDYSCRSVFDSKKNTSWAAKSERIGAWIYIDLKRYYELSKILIRRRFFGPNYDFHAEVQSIIIQFSDGSRKGAVLAKREINGMNINDFWPNNITESINITVKSVFNPFTLGEDSNVGFSEIKICGLPVKGDLHIRISNLIKSLF